MTSAGLGRICSCGAEATGLRPPGWLIEPIWSYVAGTAQAMVTGETATCPDCRGAGQAAKDRERVAAFLNALPFVRWDRFVESADALVVYGWIDRDDNHADFVLVTFAADSSIERTTSSAAYSRQISVTVLGDAEGHRDCQRVESAFGDLVTNAVRRAPAEQLALRVDHAGDRPDDVATDGRTW